MLSHHRAKIIYILLLLALTLPSRLTRIEAAVNIDEPWWVISSSNFYYANQGQLAHHLNFVNAMAQAEPFHVVWLNGYEYVRIYKVDDLGPEIYEALANLK